MEKEAVSNGQPLSRAGACKETSFIINKLLSATQNTSFFPGDIFHACCPVPYNRRHNHDLHAVQL